MTLEEQVLRYLDGTLTGPQLEQWFVREGVLPKLLGDEQYSKLLTLGADAQGETVWSHLRAHLGDRFPAQVVRERARAVCQGLLDGTVETLSGVRRMWVLRQGDVNEWARIDRALSSVPAPEQYALWAPAALAERLKSLELHREAVMKAARALLVEPLGS